MDYRCGTWQPSETSKKWATFDASSYDTCRKHGALQETTIQGKPEKYPRPSKKLQNTSTYLQKKYHTNIQKSREHIR